ncbi:hypothetical protein EXN66_Car011747 [Channa argus]|uniref:Taste receptor type 2 n=1 Tax=Channa argus TaxID=215402 RepID=A0A6G1Q0E0_CHAAH|nr:hypothetical protein EXN66_Car011747 [Channa argus]
MFTSCKFNIWIITGLLAVTTVFFNAYMFSMSLLSFKQKKLCATDAIIMALSVASVAHQLVCYFWMTTNVLDSMCLIFQMPYTGVLLLTFSLKLTITWDSSFLTLYYSTKLVSSPNHCYTQIQAAILRHVTLAVCVIPLCSLGTCMPMFVVFNTANHTKVNKDCELLPPSTYYGHVYVAIYLLLSDLLPGLLMAKCCISISVHLIIHLRHMKASTNGAHCPKLGSQMRVVRMALSLVAIFTIFLVVDLYVHYQFAFIGSKLSACAPALDSLQVCYCNCVRGLECDTGRS